MESAISPRLLLRKRLDVLLGDLQGQQAVLELGFDIHSLDQADVSKENILEKLKRAKDHKKYS